MIDLQAVFCAGAWAAAVIIAAAIVENQARLDGRWRRAESAAPRDKSSRMAASLRNRLLHEDQSKPALTVEDQWFRRDRWEDHARQAVEQAFQALYGSAGAKKSR